MLSPLPSGAVLFVVTAFVYYALRGPFVELPRSPLAVFVALVSIFVLGQLARLAALALEWGFEQVFAADLFQERAPLELLDELSPRKLGAEVTARLAGAVKEAFDLELPRIARTDDDALRDGKSRALEEIFALARARAAAQAFEHVSSLEGRVEGARALFAALFLATLLLLATAVHDLFFAHAVAHAFSSFWIVVSGVLLGFAALAALGWARLQARRFALDVLLLLSAGRRSS